MRYGIRLALVLTGLWLAWSGHTEPLILGLGAGSVLFVVWLTAHMKILDAESVPVGIDYVRLALYIPWLSLEIVKANLDVARRILTPGPLRISPHLLRVPASQRTAAGKVFYANSITLTPGTVSVDVLDGEILVHALSNEAAEGVREGTMHVKCVELEGGEA